MNLHHRVVHVLRTPVHLNLPMVVADHVVGKHHSEHHRMIAGFAVMVVGVGIAKSANLFEFTVWHFGVDLVGYAVHGLGLTPYVERLLRTEA